MTSMPVFDGHNDLLSSLYRAGGLAAAQTYLDGRDGHLDQAKVRAGGFAGGFFAIWIPTTGDFSEIMAEMQKPAYDLPLADPIPHDAAMPVAVAQAEILKRLEALGALKLCTSTQDIRACIDGGTVAAILHMEGAEAIDPEFRNLDTLYSAGLRSLGPVWSRNTIFAEAVPFTFPSSPDVGSGLTELGKTLIKRCNALGIMIDLSHLNEAGFWDVADLSTAPLVATHSNAHAICPHARNLTDAQLEAVAKSKGVVGLNFATALLREDGKMDADCPIGIMLRHLDHMLGILGEDSVALGSDFDGAVVPAAIGDASGLPHLLDAMSDHGYSDSLIEKIRMENWLRVLDATWVA